MATIVRRTSQEGHVTFLVRVRRKGAPSQTATFQKLSDAKKWAQIIEGAVAAGQHFPTTEAKRHTVGALIDRYVQDILPHKRNSTLRDQQRQLQWWKTQLGQYPLSELSPARIVACRDLLARTRANGTVNRYLAAFSHALSIAVREWQWCEDNPMRKVRKLKEPRGRVRFLSEEERHRLLESCRASRNKQLYLVTILALATGARRMELLRLTWQDVNLQRGVLIFQHTKNGERRQVPLSGYALQLLSTQAAHQQADTDLVFPRRKNKKIPMCLRKAWEQATQRAGIPDFRFHDLRHSAASYLAMNGASLMEIAEVLGHKSLNMVKRYAHLSESHTRSIVARMNQVIFGG
jgi:integrase